MEKRAAWRAEQAKWKAERLVFLDETATTTNMARRYGRAKRDQRLIDKIPHSHRQTTTFIAALRHDQITAPLVLDGAMNGSAFLAYVEQILLPTLQPGDIVVMDNVAMHKVAGVRRLFAKARVRLRYLPPYSPDLNPIEMAFSKLKAALRKAAERTISALWDRIGTLIQTFSAQECINFFKAAGYGFN